jgi:protein phosphatase
VRLFEPAEPIGQHLSVVRLLRQAEGRHFYLINNLSRKWMNRKCWSCGNRYSPLPAQACTFCSTPLQDLQFIMTTRWNDTEFEAFQALVRARIVYPSILQPVAILLKSGQMLSVYHYNGERFLLDEPSPLPPTGLLRLAWTLADGLAFLHQMGVVLGQFGPANVAIMPDDSARWFDLPVERLAGDLIPYRADLDNPVHRDTVRLGQLMGSYCGPDEPDLAQFFERVAEGALPGPGALCRTLGQMLRTRSGTVDRVSNVSAWSDVGRTRDVNEDSWGWRRLDQKAVLYAVADGMGGHESGEVASRLAITTCIATIQDVWPPKKADPKTLEGLLESSLVAANKAIRQLAAGRAMGSTLTAVLVIDNYVVVAHVGDTRLYLYDGAKLHQLTDDHSLAWALMERGKITKDAIRDHPKSSTLLVALGLDDELDVDTRSFKASKGTRLLLCSDGLWHEVDEHEIGDRLGNNELVKRAVYDLVRSAVGFGGRDNVTALALTIE